MIGWNNSLIRNDVAESRVQNATNHVEAAVLQARDLTQQLLTFSSRGAPHLETICLDQLIVDAVSIITSEPRANCELSLADDLLPVEVDAGMFRQVLNNLLINAAQSMPLGGLIRLRAKNVIDPEISNRRFVEIKVRDNGIGIPRDQIERVFEPYSNSETAGSGIGLASAYSIVQEHGGTLIVESEMGVGTCFCILLPASNRMPQNPPVAGHATQFLPSGRVLIVADHAGVRATLAGMLKPVGFEAYRLLMGKRRFRFFDRNSLKAGVSMLC